MNIGVFSNADEYADLTPEMTAQKIQAAGLDTVQLYLTMADIPDHPALLTQADCLRIREAFQTRGVKIATLGAFGNLSHPDPAKRQEALDLVKYAARWAKWIGTDTVSSMTGSYNLNNEWLDHPYNHTREALDRAIRSICEATAIAVEYGVKMCVEPYYFSIVDTAERMFEVLHAAGPNLGVMYDPAAMVGPDRIHDSASALRHDFKLLFDRFLIAHVEDVYFENGTPHFVTPGQGGIDWAAYYQLLRDYEWTGPIVIEVHQDVAIQRRSILSSVGRLG